MRDLIGCLATWLGPGVRRALERGNKRIRVWLDPAPTPQPPAILPRRPQYDYDTLPDHVRQRRQPLDGDEIGLVRPYYITHEQHLVAEQVRRNQKERRTAAALASLGIDYDPVLAQSLEAAS